MSNYKPNQSWAKDVAKIILGKKKLYVDNCWVDSHIMKLQQQHNLKKKQKENQPQRLLLKTHCLALFTHYS